jgi:CubicO group peptidase (beta-lactamase class C family)
MKNPRLISSIASAGLALTTLACSSDGNSQQPSSAGAGTLDFKAFDAAVTKFVTDHGLQGASAVLVQKDQGIVHTAGYGGYSKDRVYLVMSSSKILSAGILLRLADQGKLDLDAPIAKYVSAWGTRNPDITVAELISGSSGLVGIVDNLAYVPYACQGDPSTTLATCASTIYTADDSADRKQPDTEFHYGGGAWQVAGGVAEVVSGKSWADLVKETYSDGCGVPAIGFTNATQILSFNFGEGGTLDFSGIGYPKTFDGDPTTLPQTQNPSIEGGLYTSVDDYGKLLWMHLRGGMCGDTRVLSEAAVKKMQTDRIASYGGNTNAQMKLIVNGATQAALDYALKLSGYGMGWWVNREEPGVVFDPGAFGSMAWIDGPRGYAAFIAIEGNVVLGAELGVAVKPSADAIFDGAKP